MFRFATGSGQRVEWRLVREFDTHLKWLGALHALLLLSCIATVRSFLAALPGPLFLFFRQPSMRCLPCFCTAWLLSSNGHVDGVRPTVRRPLWAAGELAAVGCP